MEYFFIRKFWKSFSDFIEIEINIFEIEIEIENEIIYFQIEIQRVYNQNISIYGKSKYIKEDTIYSL